MADPVSLPASVINIFIFGTGTAPMDFSSPVATLTAAVETLKGVTNTLTAVDQQIKPPGG